MINKKIIMENTRDILPVDRLYDGRKDFSIIGLTGVAGSGCSSLADMMELTPTDFLNKVREPNSINIDFKSIDKFDNNESIFNDGKQSDVDKVIKGLVFKQKYTICYEFAKANYPQYKVLKYTHALWLYTLLYAKKNGICDEKGIKEELTKVLIDKYCPERKSQKCKVKDADDKKYIKLIKYSVKKRKEFILKILEEYKEWKNLCENLNKLKHCYVDNLEFSKNNVQELYEFTKKGGPFNNFVKYILKKLAEEDYYSHCLLHHWLAGQIRMCGNPFHNFTDAYNHNKEESKYLYNIVGLINILIKSYKKSSGGKNCRVVIDSLRNSLEARFFKERYAAFYLVCVNNDSNNQDERLCNVVKEKMPKTKRKKELRNLVCNRIKNMTKIESDNEDFNEGSFASPDIENVIADAEIHINNNIDSKDAKSSDYDFCTMAEQWMKYSSLILHPGLITPSAEERCMVVAYTAKFNSSCLSRQVGAVITNQYHSIRTIGWNDVPYGQMPCGLRELHKILYDKHTDSKYIYSNFEIGEQKYYNEESFKEKVCENNPDLKCSNPTCDKPDCIKDLPYSYCFKTLHNKFEGEKNQVFTRSLHAEENAILQMAKYGGEPLMNGVIYVTASPCELCAKKLYQIGVRKIVYIDPYPGISRDQIIRAGFKHPRLKLFQGAYGASYFKLYQPFMSYKDELDIRLEHKSNVITGKKLLSKILDELGAEEKLSYTKGEMDIIIQKVKDRLTDNDKDSN